MFFSTFKNTLKTLFRSVTFWLVLGVLFLYMLDNELRYFMRWAPGFVPETLDYVAYRAGYLTGAFAGQLREAIPFVSIVLALLILNRDYNDNFYEIENAANVKPLTYFLGRMFGIAAAFQCIHYLIAEVMTNISVIRWGGVEGMSIGSYLLDVISGGLLHEITEVLPCVLLYASMTYAFAALFRNNFVGGIVGFLHFISYRFLPNSWDLNGIWRTVVEFYIDYMSQAPRMLLDYIKYYTIAKEDYYSWGASTLGEAALALGIMIAFIAIFSVSPVGAFAKERYRICFLPHFAIR